MHKSEVEYFQKSWVGIPENPKYIELGAGLSEIAVVKLEISQI